MRAQALAHLMDHAEVETQMADKKTQAKSNFLAHMSHEIRAPLKRAIGMTEILSATYLQLEQRDYLNDIRNSGQAFVWSH